MTQDGKAYWLDRPENVTRLFRGLWVVGIVLVALDFVVRRHGEVEFDERFGFYALFGFIACVALVLAAKLLLRRAVMRPEDYYDH